MTLPTDYQEFVYKRSYAKWLYDEERRENFQDTVKRFQNYMVDRIPTSLVDYFNTQVIPAIENLEIMPSMRAFWTAGEALDFDNICGFNCAYTVIERPKDFAEILYILMNGTGVGFSTEEKYVEKLPEIPKEFEWGGDELIIVGDSKQGWAEAFLLFLEQLYDGRVPSVDYSKVRPKGAPLKTFGGRASGPEPLKNLFEFTRETFEQAQGRKLKPIEAYDIVCMIAEVVIVGGVRRSATINLSDLENKEMRTAKTGDFWENNPQRQLSNNSAVFHGKPDPETFLAEWKNLVESGSGERGIVNRDGLRNNIFWKTLDRDPDYEFGVNPCGETILRPRQFCNLSEAVVRPKDDFKDLEEKVRKAVFLGILQSTLTDYNFISDEWRENQEEERLLGVSLTGMRDHPVIGTKNEKAKRWLNDLRMIARDEAEHLAEKFSMPTPAAITTVKPSGTVSQVVNSASGIHPRFAEHYIRRVRVATSDPICDFLINEGVPHEPEIGQDYETAETMVFEFPVKAPHHSVKKGEKSAIEQLEYWKMVKKYWTEHNPSQTIYVDDDEWIEVGNWVYDNFDIMTGVSFLPKDGGDYDLAPYEEISADEYERKKAEIPQIDWDKLNFFEQEDRTGGGEMGCDSESCKII